MHTIPYPYATYLIINDCCCVNVNEINVSMVVLIRNNYCCSVSQELLIDDLSILVCTVDHVK